MMEQSTPPPASGAVQAGVLPAPNCAVDPVASFFADPQSHLADILYLYFRAYKRRLMARFFEHATAQLQLAGRRELTLADVGASMGFDCHYLLNLKTAGFTREAPWGRTKVDLIEGNARYVAAGDQEWNRLSGKAGIAHRYFHVDITQTLPLPDSSCDVVLCSEVVEHFEQPEKIFAEIHRVLTPGGFLIFTTDNSPNAFQWARRLPAWLSGSYRRRYSRPDKNETIDGYVEQGGVVRPIYGHINLNPTRHWEHLCRQAGFEIASFGTYESIRRGGGGKKPAALAGYFVGGFLVSLLPVRIGRFFGDTTALLLRKPMPRPKAIGAA